MSDKGSLRQMITEAMGERVPAEIQGRVDEMVAELRLADAVPGLAVGEPAPDFTLPTPTGDRFDSTTGCVPDRSCSPSTVATGAPSATCSSGPCSSTFPPLGSSVPPCWR